MHLLQSANFPGDFPLKFFMSSGVHCPSHSVEAAMIYHYMNAKASDLFLLTFVYGNKQILLTLLTCVFSRIFMFSCLHFSARIFCQLFLLVVLTVIIKLLSKHPKLWPKFIIFIIRFPWSDHPTYSVVKQTVNN